MQVYNAHQCHYVQWHCAAVEESHWFKMAKHIQL